MLYKVVNDFIDKEDNDTHYLAGEVYPKGDYKPSKKRIGELSKEHPIHKRFFIEEVKEEKKSSKKVKG
jgi:hypothetical protein